MRQTESDTLCVPFARSDATGSAAGSTGLLMLAGEHQLNGKFDEAARLYAAAMAADRNLQTSPRLHAILAGVLQQSGRFEASLSSCAKLVELEPGSPESYNMLGRSLLALGRAPLAVGAYAMMVHLDQRNPQAHNYLGHALQEAKRFADAETAFRNAAKLFPGNVIVLCNIAALLLKTGRYTEALTLCDKALAIDPASFPGVGNRSVALHGLGRHEEAIAAGRQALALKPSEPEAQHNLAAWLLAAGQMTAEAWELLEGRHGLRSMKPRSFPVPQWLGEDPSGRTILIHAAAGFGDTLQFARYLPLLVEKGARVIVEVYASLHRLFRDIEGIAVLVLQGEPLPSYDMHCSFESLPRAFRTTLDTIPRADAWLHRQGHAGLSQSGRLLRVGLVWGGNKNFAFDHQRSMALADLLPLWNVPGVAFVSLQVGPAVEDLASLPPACPIENPMAAVADYVDTAEIMATLDLMICVDTSVAHLAGTMGLPVWMLSRHNGCWRWLHDRTDSPWYPTMTIYRQPPGEGWAGVVQAVGADLAALAAAKEP